MSHYREIAQRIVKVLISPESAVGFWHGVKSKKEVIIGLIFSYAGAFIGGLLVFLCAYWFFILRPGQRGVSISLTLLAVRLLTKLVPEKYR